MTISRKRRGSFGSYDIEDEEVILERKVRRQLANSLAFQHRIRNLDSRSRASYNQELRSKGVSRLASFVAAYDKMLVKKNKPKGIGATYRAKKKAKNFGATPAFNRALVAAVKKVESKSHETFYSDFGIQFNSATAQASGTFNVGGFQAAPGAAANTSANIFSQATTAHVISLPAQIQTGNGGQNGYRRGQIVEPVGFQWWFRGFLKNMTQQHTFHFCLARWKGGAPPALGAYPAQGTMTQLSLFEAGGFGPNSSAFVTSSAEFQSGSRFNRDIWDIKMHKSFRVNPVQTLEASNSNNSYAVPVKFDGYYKFKENVWDFQTNIGTTIKGGDYFMICWQESYEPSPVSGISQQVYLQLNMELSFKDA